MEKKLIKILYWLTIRLSHKTIAVSDALKNQIFNELPSIKNKISVIKNALALEVIFQNLL